MSDTPRTDAAKWCAFLAEPSPAGMREVVDVNFAQILERELTACTQEVERLRDACNRKDKVIAQFDFETIPELQEQLRLAKERISELEKR